MAAWRTPGVLDRVVDAGPGPMPGRVLAGINLLDTATHTWDLATATGQPAELPEPVAVAALEASGEIVSPELRPGRFGPEQAAPDGASTTDAARRLPRPDAVTVASGRLRARRRRWSGRRTPRTALSTTHAAPPGRRRARPSCTARGRRAPRRP